MHGVSVVAEILKREGIEYLCAFPAQPLIEECARIGIVPVLCRQERIGMGIADGFSRTTNGKRLGVFTMQQGPGAENAYPGAAQAFADNVPILLLPAGVATDRSHVSPEYDSVEGYRIVTKWGARANYTRRIPELMRMAFYQLRTGKGGPVLVEVPHDIWDSELDGDLDYTPVVGNSIAPDPSDIEAIADVLLSNDSAIVHAGQGVMYAEATDELIEFAELLEIPILTTMTGKSGFPENHPLSIGSCMRSLQKGAAYFLKHSEVIFGIGCSFSKTGFGPQIPEGKRILHSTIDYGDVNKDQIAECSAIGDAKLVLRALIDTIKERTNGQGRRNSDVVSKIASLKKEWLNEWMPQLTSDEVPINQYRVIWDMLHSVDRDNTIITHDSGSPREQLVPFWESTSPRTYMGWGKSTQLGYGLGIIMGAKLAEPDKLCVNVMGDAAIGMVGMDIETAVRNKLGIITVVFNNGAMAIERGSMPEAAEKHLYLGGNYSELAKSLGAWSQRVENPGDFKDVFNKAKENTKSGQPALIEVIVKEGYDFSRYPQI
ncbi:MAG: thiamine pyrophosphate-requiring protein [Chloroflexota bacterium]|nr:thiamine pyrophosphate-requiring protein [Chloroflexota bacterium]